MNSTDYTSLLNQPEAVNERQTEALEKIVTEFPYFQSARALRLKGLYNQNSFQYNYALKVAAAYTTDRSVLFDFITSDTFTTIQKGQYEEKVAEIHNITVSQSEVIEDKPKEDKIEYVDTAELAKQSILTSIKEAEAIETPAEEAEVTGQPEAVTEAEIESYKVENEPEPINAEDFGPVDEPQFLPEAVAPIEFVPVTMPHIEEEATEVAEAGPIADTSEIEPEAETAIEEAKIEEVTAETVETITEETAIIEEKLEIGKPFEFSKTETHSFSEWLQLSKLQPIVRDTPVANTIKTEEHTNEVKAQETASGTQDTAEPGEAKISQNDLIDRFIETNPKIPKITQDLQPAAVAESKLDHSSLMTETLARVYLEQKKYQKAIQAYEILILKYPEKSSFFADRISEIKNLQQNNIL